MGLPRAVVAVLVTLMALGMFVGAEKVEKIFSKRAPANLEQWTTPAEGRRLSFATMAMASVGLGTNLKRLRELGLKPLAAGLAAALIVGGVAAGLIHLLASTLTTTV